MARDSLAYWERQAGYHVTLSTRPQNPSELYGKTAHLEEGFTSRF
jgi:hypothetical protein